MNYEKEKSILYTLNRIYQHIWNQFLLEISREELGKRNKLVSRLVSLGISRNCRSVKPKCLADGCISIFCTKYTDLY